MFFKFQYETNDLIQISQDEANDLFDSDREVVEHCIQSRIDYYTSSEVNKDMIAFFNNHKIISVTNIDSECDVYITK